MSETSNNGDLDAALDAALADVADLAHAWVAGGRRCEDTERCILAVLASLREVRLQVERERETRATIAASPEVLDEYRAAARERQAHGKTAPGKPANASGQSDPHLSATRNRALVEAARAIGAGEANTKRMARVHREDDAAEPEVLS